MTESETEDKEIDKGYGKMSIMVVVGLIATLIFLSILIWHFMINDSEDDAVNSKTVQSDLFVESDGIDDYKYVPGSVSTFEEPNALPEVFDYAVDSNDGDNTDGFENEAFPCLVQTTATNLNIRYGPGKNYDISGLIKDKGIYTIVEQKSGEGSVKGWGKLKSGAGWISLDFCKKLQ